MVKKQDKDCRQVLIDYEDYVFFLFKTMKPFIDDEVKQFFIMQVRGRAISKKEIMKDMKTYARELQGGREENEPSEYIH